MHYLKLQYTDWLFILFFICIIVMLWRSLKSATSRSMWINILRSPVAMCSLILMTFFLIIAFLDCIHFYNPLIHPQSYTLLDKIIYWLQTNTEKTYSSPFATHLLVKTTSQASNGLQRIFLPLQHIHPIHHFIWYSIKLILIVSVIMFLLTTAYAFITACITKTNIKTYISSIYNGKTNTAQRTAITTIWIMTLTLSLVLAYSMHYHILGTDKIGRDVLYLTIKSIRTGVIIGTLTTIVMLPLALMFGCISGYFGGWVDEVVVYIYTTISSIPGVLLISAVLLASQIMIANHPGWFDTMYQKADIRLLLLCAILGLTSWTGLCRLLRAETFKIRQMDYVSAAKVMNVSSWRIMRTHVFPNVLYLILITLVMDFSGLVLAEAVLSYVGVGVDPTTISWGNMINMSRMELARSPVVWWPLIASLIPMFLLVLSVNLFANRVQWVYDHQQGAH